MSEQEKKQVASLLGCDVMKPEDHPESEDIGTSLLMGVMLDSMAEKGLGKGTFADAGITEKELPPTLAIMAKRIEILGDAIRVSDGAKLFASRMCKTPAESVMWAYTLCCIAEANGGEAKTLNVIESFTSGPPTELAYRTAWDAQKSPDAPMGNLLDDPATWARFVA